MSKRAWTYYDADGQAVWPAMDSYSSKTVFEQKTGLTAGRWVRGVGYTYGYRPDNSKAAVQRRVAYKVKNPSLHKCDGRCRSAKGHNCECECGGKNHGIFAF